MAYDEYGLNDQAMSAYEEEERRRRQNPTIGEAADQALDRFKGKFTDSNGDFSMGKYVAGQMAGGGMNQPTSMEKQLMQGAGVSAQPGFMTGAQPGVAPVAPQQAQQPMMQPAPQPVNPQQSTYADRVAQNESGAGGYDAIYGYGNAGGDPSIAATGGRNLSELSIGEALKLGDSRMGNNAGALGKYQFLPSTLRGLMGSTGLTEDDKFDAASQEKLFQALSSANASSLEKQGIQPNETNLALAHAVGAGGAAKLLDPNNASLIAADVLGLTGAGRTTNPQLNKPVSEYLAGMSGKFGGQQPTVASVGREMGMGEPGYGGADNIPTVETGVKNEDTATVLANAHSTVEQLASIVSNPNESKLAKQVALNRMKTLSDAPTKLTEANKTIAAAGEGDASATRDVNNALKPPKDGKNEGSWLKALLLAKLGLGEAATREFALLGIGSTEHGINLDGKKGVVTMDGKGTIIKGYVEGKDGESQDMSAEQIAKANSIAAETKRGTAGATLMRDAQGKQWSVVPTTAGSKFYDVATGQEGRPDGKLTPVQGQTDTDIMNYKSRLAITEHAAKKQIDFTNDMSKMSTDARIAGFKEINNLRVMAGKEPFTPQQMGLTPSGNIIGMEPAAVPATGAAPYGGQGLQVPGVSRPIVPAPVTQQPAVQPAPVVEAPAVQPAPVVEAPAVQPVTAVQSPAKPEPTGVELAAQAAAAMEEATKRAAQDVTNEKEVEIKRVANKEAAVTTLPHLEKIGELIEKSTGSGIGAKVDKAGNFIGYSTEGAKAIAQIAPLADKILKSVERFSGPQSDLDVKSYKEASGQLADPTVPAEQKQAALRSVISILNKYAPDLDWSKAYRGKDREAYNWAQKNKDDPRAEVIRKQLGL